MWQVSALLLGKYVLSGAEFEGLMAALLPVGPPVGTAPGFALLC